MVTIDQDNTTGSDAKLHANWNGMYFATFQDVPGEGIPTRAIQERGKIYESQ